MEKKILNNRLPLIELCYGKELHRKVHGDLFQIRPKGKKCLLWYTYFNSENICYILFLNNDLSSIIKIERFITSFSTELCLGLGTLVSGIFTSQKFNIFSITDIHYFKGQNLNQLNFENKFTFFYYLLNNEINPQIFLKEQLIVCSCILTDNYNNALDFIDNLDYSVDEIGVINNNHKFIYGTLPYINNPKKFAIFNIKANINFDIYHLYLENNLYYSNALIPNYKTSIMMNKLFRKIKENDNLDLLEESDSEDEFENIDIDKYVNLDKILKFKCVFNPIIKKWQPLENVEENLDLTSKEKIIDYEKKSNYNIYGRYSKSSQLGKSKKYSR
tara:strand:- start:2974 stop:3966 length:993 start_codon:yes stop_codon:yes gene_type:complete